MYISQARHKGISDALSGWVFGIFALVQCLTSPIFGKLVSIIDNFLFQLQLRVVFYFM